MLRKASSVLIIVLLCQASALAGLGSKKAAYMGGTVAGLRDSRKVVEGVLDTSDNDQLRFVYKINKVEQTTAIPYSSIIDLEYGQKAGRRVGVAIGTTILLGPLGLLSLFSKKRKHYLTIGFKDPEGKDQVGVFELGKDIVRTTLAIVETRSGKQMEYQDDSARKAAKGN
jgi:hypothetical protein